jgi:dTDP-D-glucose 4,6-dehydratase
MPATFSANVEANTLRIAIDKAVTELAWQPRWHLHQTIHRTVDWYQDYYRHPRDLTREHSLADIDAYVAEAHQPNSS